MPDESAPQESQEPAVRGGGFRPWMSLLILAGFVLVLAILFYQVIQPLILPLFMAAVVAMLCQPLHVRLTPVVGGRAWLSALTLTLVVLVAVVGPLSIIAWQGFLELRTALTGLQELGLGDLLGGQGGPHAQRFFDTVSRSTGIAPETLQKWILKAGAQLEEFLYTRSLAFLGGVPDVVLGLVLFVFAVFFLLKDSDQIIREWDDLTPLEPSHDAAIREEFSRVFRGVVLGTLAAAVAQAVSFALGFFVLNWAFGLGAGAWIFFLTVLTLVCSTIPFVGAGVVWTGLAVVLFLQNEIAAGVCVAVYGAGFISQIDNVIRIWILNDTARIHPLLGFVAVFGGIQLLGILGILVGPVTAAMLFATMRILKRQALRLSRESQT